MILVVISDFLCGSGFPAAKNLKKTGGLAAGKPLPQFNSHNNAQSRFFTPQKDIKQVYDKEVGVMD